MTSSILIELLLGLVIIAYIGSKQLTWRRVDPSRVWKLPLILGAVGIVSMARQGGPVRPVDVVILGLSFAFALGSGVVMGRITRFRSSPMDPRLLESRTGVLGIVIWLGLVAVRVALDVEGHRLGSMVAVSTGSILLVLALNRAASALVVSARQPRRRSFTMAGK